MEKCKILPTIVYRKNIENDFSFEIKSLIQNEPVDKNGNQAHHFSINKYVLDSPEYLDLKSHIENLATEYFNDVLQIDGQALITQSWVNANKPNEFTHLHVHPNSFVSGVLYLQVSGENAGIRFHKYQHVSSNTTYTLQPKTTGKDFGSELFEVKSGDLIVFPSYLPHSVPKNSTNDIRWSLAFNVLTKDTIGDLNRLTEFKF